MALLRLVDDLFADEGDLVEQVDAALGVGGALDRLRVEPLELAPFLGAGEDLLQAREGALVARPSLEDALEVGRGGLGIAELLVVQAAARSESSISIAAGRLAFPRNAPRKASARSVGRAARTASSPARSQTASSAGNSAMARSVMSNARPAEESWCSSSSARAV